MYTIMWLSGSHMVAIPYIYIERERERGGREREREREGEGDIKRYLSLGNQLTLWLHRRETESPNDVRT